MKILFILRKLGSIKRLTFGFCANNSGFDKYLFQLVTLLNPDFNCCSSLELSCVDKVTTGTCDFVSIILNAPAPVELVITQVDDHVKMRLTSQLLKYFNGSIISTSFSLPLVFPVIFVLDLNGSESARLSFGSSL